ncbi:Uncharacterized protein ChrSV_1965 [Chromobacterium vaccinii]|nr:Uncharacterized protein ChrSW_1965 [Chromobacterium vaccinii]QND89423.1 Uncharacterized protein ChrSV_1965 [Chromobacterium vaccinii]
MQAYLALPSDEYVTNPHLAIDIVEMFHNNQLTNHGEFTRKETSPQSLNYFYGGRL